MAKQKQSTKFRFHMVDLKPGDIVIHIPTGRKAIVHDDQNKIVFDDEVTTMTQVHRAYIHALGKLDRNSFAGPSYFSYNGENLRTMRKRIHKERIIKKLQKVIKKRI